ncbi:MAG: hypothetical protein ACI9WU_003961 [Myxococcota bacterium]|jgi:hypothetical protein
MLVRINILLLAGCVGLIGCAADAGGRSASDTGSSAATTTDGAAAADGGDVSGTGETADTTDGADDDTSGDDTSGEAGTSGDTGDTGGAVDTGSDDTGSDDTGSDDTGSDDTGSDDTGSESGGTSGGLEPPELEVTEQGDGWLVLSEHYQLTAPVSEEEAWVLGWILEAAYPAMRDYFGGDEPALAVGERLVVDIYASTADFDANVTYPDGSTINAGGYFDPATDTASAIMQPSRWFTRSLMLHEAAHQFHWLARTGSNTPDWYAEGLAEHLQLFDFDGTSVTLGVTPLLSLEDTPKKALAVISDGGYSLAAMLDTGAGWTRAIARQLFRFMAVGKGGAYSADFDAFRQAVDDGATNHLELFESLVGDADTVHAEMIDHATSDQEPLDIVFVEWTHLTPNRLLAEADPGIISFAVMKQPSEAIGATLDRSDIEEKAGLIFGYASNDNYSMATVTGAGKVEIVQISNGDWTWLETASVGETTIELVATASPGGTTVSVGDSEFGPFAGSGRFGLLNWGSVVVFDAVDL